MKITKRQLRRIIREEKAKLSDKQLLQNMIREQLIMHTAKSGIPIKEQTKRSSVYVLTSSRPKVITFGKLMEDRRRGRISENQMIRLWHRSVDYQLSQIDEGLMDALRSAYETTKSGAIKLKDKISDAAKAAWEKANNMFLDLSLQAWAMAQKSIEAAVSATKKIWASVQRFKEAHPILFKIITITLITILIFAAMSMFGSEAQAAVKMKGGRGAGGNMSETQYRILRGALDEYGSTKGIGSDASFNAGKAIAELDRAFKSSDTVNMETMGKLVQGGQKMVANNVKAMEAGDEGAFELLKQWLNVGKSLGDMSR